MRLGLIAGALALLAALGIGSFVAYKMLFPAEPKVTVTTTDSNKSAESPPAQPAAEAPKDGTPSTGTATATAPDSNMSSQQTLPAATAADSSATPVQTPDAAKAAADAKAKAAADAKAKAAAKSDTPPAPGAPVAAPAPSPPRQASAPAVAQAAQQDRWELMRQAYEVCNKESLFDRLACNSRVGQQYCKGYWGTVPQCPAGAYGDRTNNN
jgi:hypothetical protein